MPADQIAAGGVPSAMATGLVDARPFAQRADLGALLARNLHSAQLRLKALGRWASRAAASTHSYPFAPAHEFKRSEGSRP